MNRRTPLKDLMEDAAKARADLNIFYGVIALLEGGTVSADSNRETQRIISLCKSAGSKCLRRYDKAIAAAHKDSHMRRAAEEER